MKQQSTARMESYIKDILNLQRENSPKKDMKIA